MYQSMIQRISTKQLTGFLIFFWSLTMIASGLWLFLQVQQQGLVTLLQHSVFALYIFLLLFLSLLKLLVLVQFQSTVFSATVLLLVELLSLNLMMILPLWLLRNRMSNQEKHRSVQDICLLVLLLAAVLLQLLLLLQLCQLN
ncbi:hypothetical protein [Enterococcus florum]|uniref:hypothetical protein n=1 Tax=Enterococcus florum TaxID=2480627 RepID=UPI0011BA98BA|nr:hypothetical protein [Enterococcus florum]